MLRKMLATLLIGTALSAQVPPKQPIVAKQASDASAEIDASVVYRESKVRAGHDTELAIIQGVQDPNCLYCRPDSGDRLLLTKLVFQPSPGFSFQYADISGRKFKADPSGRSSITKAGAASLVKIHADKGLPPGERELHAKATFIVNKREQKEIELSIPITVVSSSERIALNAWPYVRVPGPRRHVGRDVLHLVVMVGLYPVILVVLVTCTVDPHFCSGPL